MPAGSPGRPPDSSSSSSGGGGTRRLTARGRDRRRTLIEFATACFAEQGFHPTSVSDIVDGIGVGKGVFYWYFPSKDDLLLEILRQSHFELRQAQVEAMEAEDDPLRRIERSIEASLRWSAQHPDVLRLVMFGWTEETFAKALRKGRRIAIADTARHVRDAMDRGLIAPGDPTVLATALRGVTDEVARQYVLGGRPLDDEVVQAAVRMCLYGLVGPRG
jgi:AcrR family transcriptional regulator